MTVYSGLHCGLMVVVCFFLHGNMSLLSSQLSYSSSCFLKFLNDTKFLYLSLGGVEVGEPVGGTPHLTSQMRCKEVVNAFWGKCVLELDVLMTEHGGKKKKKNYAASPNVVL